MIHIKANTAEEIALALRGRGAEFDQALQVAEVTNRLLGIKKKSSKGVVVTAPRQSGKTTEMLKYAEEMYPYGQFAVLCRNKYVISSVCHIYRDIRSYVNASPPLMLTMDNLHLLNRERKPLFCDELSLFSEKDQQEILNYSCFEAAVTS